MDFVKAGKVVKFIDENGEKNAGTVVEIVKQQGIKKAVINTIEGKTIVKNLKEQINDLEKMKVSIIHLAKALKVRTTELGESKTINELLTCILELNNLGELVVD